MSQRQENKTRERWSRRDLLQAGAAAIALGVHGGDARGQSPMSPTDSQPPDSPAMAAALARLEPFFTPPGAFRDVSRGDPIPHTLSNDRLAAAGLTRETWRLEVISDPDHPARIRRPLTRADGTALDFAALLELGQTRAVKFAKVMTCLNIGCPLGMGVWEGVPLRDVFWLAQPREDVRRVFYYGFHNDDPKQLFQSSLPLSRVLEDPYDLPPVILCYKLNGQWLDAQRGGPVRIVVPEAYGFKSIKWLARVVISNLPHANDTYAEGNNDLDSPLKTFAATFPLPDKLAAGEPIPVTGYAQVGISGLTKVQAWVAPRDQEWPADDRFFALAPWRDARVLPPPAAWGGDLPDGKIPEGTFGFDAQGKPQSWPMRLGKVHWAVELPGAPPGRYTLRCRTIDEKGQAQPHPRSLPKSGHNAIEEIEFEIT